MEAEHVPVDVVADPHVSVPEPVRLSELEVFLTELSDEHASIRGTQIDRDNANHLRWR